MKKYSSKMVSNLAFLLAIVSIAFAISFTFNFFGGFELKSPETFDAILGEDKTIVMSDYGSQSISLIFSGKILPGEQIKQKIQVKLPNVNLDGYNIKIKAYVGLSTPQTNVRFMGFGGWEQNSQDGYYYYNQQINKLQELGVCTDLILPNNISFKANVNYSMIFTAELYKV